MVAMRATIEYKDGTGDVIDFGEIQSVRMQYSASVSPMPSILYGYKGAFCMDLGVTMTVSFTFKRVNPSNPDDSSHDSRKWSNAHWKNVVKEQFGVWLAEHDGCRLKIISSDTTLFPSYDDTAGNFPSFIGFMSAIPTSISSGQVGLSTGSITFEIGKIEQIASQYPQLPSWSIPAQGRRAYIGYGGYRVPLGLITDLTDTLTVSTNCSSCKMPMLRAEDQFGMDTGTTNTITVSTTRVQPESGNNNAQWVYAMSSIVNRWQAETNGNTFFYVPEEDLTDDIASYNENVYVSSLVMSFSTESPDIINAKVTMQVGSICGPVTQSSQTIPTQGMTISMTSPDTDELLPISYYRDGEYISCVASMTVTGGFNQPFESLELEIPLRKLKNIQPTFKNENCILIGSTRIHLEGAEGSGGAMGKGDFIVTSTKSKNNMLTVTALSIWELFKSMTLPEDIDCRPRNTSSQDTKYGSMIHPTYGKTVNDDDSTMIWTGIIDVLVGKTMPEWFKDMFNIHGEYGVTFHGVKYVPDVLGHGDDSELAQSWRLLYTVGDVEETIYPKFKKGQNIWYVMQVCALCAGAVIGFSGNTMYLESFDSYRTSSLRALAIASDDYIDESSWFTPGASSTPTGWDGEYVGPGVPTSSTPGYIYHAYYKNIKSRITGVPTLGSSQPNDVRNIFTLRYGFQDGDEKEVIVSDREGVDDFAEMSRNMFGERADTKSLIGIGSKDTVKGAGNALIWHYAWSLEPITVSILESSDEKWLPYFGYVENFVAIVDAINNTAITRVSGDVSYIPILKLVKYVRHYPQCRSDYTFGTLSPTSLSQSLSQISQAIKSGKR